MSIFDASLRIDEGYSNLTSLLISKKGIPVYDSGWYDSSYLYFHYLQGLIFKIFGYSDSISRIFPFVLGIISLFFIYKITRLVFENRLIGVISGLITFFSYYYLVSITQARYYSMLSLFYLVGIYFILLFYQKKTTKRFFIALNVVFLVAIFQTYLYSLFVVLGTALFMIFRQNKKTIWDKIKAFDKKLFLTAILTVLIFVLFYTVLRVINPGQTAGNVSHSFQYIMFDYLKNYISFLTLNYGILLLMCYVGLANIFFAKNKGYNALLLVAFFFPFFVISKYVFMFAQRYVFFLIPLLVIIGVGTFYTYLQKLTKRTGKIVYSLIFIIFLTLTVKFNFDFTRPLSMEDIASPQPDFRSAYGYVLGDKDFATGDNVISPFPHMDYLYLKKSDYYLYIDETGVGIQPENNSYVKDGKNVYTNAVMLTGLSHLQNVQKGKISYIILDDVGMRRLAGTQILDYIQKNYTLFYHKKDGIYNINVYKLDER